MDWSKIRKALLAGLGAFVAGAVASAVKAGGFPGWPELGTSLGVAAAAGFAVWRVPNATTPPAAPVKPAA